MCPNFGFFLFPFVLSPVILFQQYPHATVQYEHCEVEVC